MMGASSLRFDARFTHLVIVDGTALLVPDDDDAVLLESPIAVDVLARIDGRLDAAGIAHVLSERYTPEAVHFVLLRLERAGVVRETRTADDAPASAVQRPIGPSISRRNEARIDRPAGTVVDSSPGIDPASEALAGRLENAWHSLGESGVAHTELSPRPDAKRHGPRIDIVLTDDYLRPAVEPAVARCAQGGGVLLARAGERSVWLGPLIGGRGRACAICVQTRLRLNLTARAFVHLGQPEGEKNIEIRGLACDPPGAAFQSLAALVLNQLAGPDPTALETRLFVQPLSDRPAEVHEVRRLPQCPGCGQPGMQPRGADVRIGPRPMVSGSPGGFRMLPPAETWRRLKHLVSPLTGVVRRIRPVPVAGTDLVHVYTAAHARQHGTPTIRAVKAARRDPSGGKGRTEMDARVSALCESLERYSGVHQGHESCRIGRLSGMSGEAIPPHELLLYSVSQYRDREASNAADRSGFEWVPEPYDDQPIAWSPVLSLRTGRTLHVPSALVFLGWRGQGRRYCKGDSNGLAGGNCIEEAILQGFLELVERDAVALWWYNRARRPGVDLGTCDDPWVHDLERLYDELGRSLWVLDITTDFDIPCFAALSSRQTERQQDIIFGFGAHIDARIALVRALTEANQMLPSVLRPPDDRRRQLLPEFEAALRWWDTATLADHPHLSPDESAVPRPLGEQASPATTDLRDAVEDCVRRAASVGGDILVHDLSRPDVGYAVARVLAPGLRHFWRRLAPGRLYDVPPALGWVDRTTAEEDLNPIPMFV